MTVRQSNVALQVDSPATQGLGTIVSIPFEPYQEDRLTQKDLQI